MVVSKDLELIFINIPQTGGNTVESTLDLTTPEVGRGLRNGRPMHHYGWKDYVANMGYNTFKKYYRIAICRNPYIRFLAHYFFCQIPGLGYKSSQTLDNFISYAENIVRTNDYYQTPLHVHFMPQCDFIYDSNGRLMVDTLFRFEEYGYVYSFLQDVCCTHTIIRNHATKFPKHIVLDRLQENRIYRLYKKDFLKLKYNFSAYYA